MVSHMMYHISHDVPYNMAYHISHDVFMTYPYEVLYFSLPSPSALHSYWIPPVFDSSIFETSVITATHYTGHYKVPHTVVTPPTVAERC